MTKTAFEEEAVGTEDVDFGNRVVGPNGPTGPKPVLKYAREMSSHEFQKHMETHLPFCEGCPLPDGGRS